MAGKETWRWTWFETYLAFGLLQVTWKSSVIHLRAASADLGLAQAGMVVAVKIVELEVTAAADAASAKAASVIGYQRNAAVG